MEQVLLPTAPARFSATSSHISFSAFRLAWPFADDEVVVHGNAQRPRDLDDRLRHLDIGARGGWDRRRDGCMSLERADVCDADRLVHIYL